MRICTYVRNYVCTSVRICAYVRKCECLITCAYVRTYIRYHELKDMPRCVTSCSPQMVILSNEVVSGASFPSKHIKLHSGIKERKSST